MLTESCRAFNSLSALYRAFRAKRIESLRLLSTAVNEEPKREPEETKGFQSFRFKYPEFLPYSDPKNRNPVRELLERRDMLRRRNVINIPNFYVGTIMAVTVSSIHAPTKSSRFLGVEVMYKLYSPLIQKIEVIKLEKRLDDELFYLRDAPNEYSTFPFDMEAEFIKGDKPVPINTIKVPLNPRPWLQRYERMDLKGVILPELPEKVIQKAKKVEKPWEKYDLMDEYRKTIPEEEQREIFSQICDELERLESKTQRLRRSVTTVQQKPSKQRLF